MATEFISATRLPELTKQLAIGNPMSPIYISPEDSILVALLNINTTATFAFSGRLLRADGATIPLFQELKKSTDGSSALTIITLAEGYLLSGSVLALTQPVLRGECFAMLLLIRGARPGEPSFAGLATGYVGSLLPLNWPWGARNEGSLDPPGFSEVIQAAGVAGGIVSIVVPARRAWVVKSILVRFVTDATAGDRKVQIGIIGLTELIFVVESSGSQPASTTFTYSAGAGAFTTGAAGQAVQVMGIPADLVLRPGYKVEVSAVGQKAGDVFQSVALLVESFQYWP